jgi:hypothetical protein
MTKRALEDLSARAIGRAARDLEMAAGQALAQAIVLEDADDVEHKDEIGELLLTALRLQSHADSIREDGAARFVEQAENFAKFGELETK